MLHCIAWWTLSGSHWALQPLFPMLGRFSSGLERKRGSLDCWGRSTLPKGACRAPLGVNETGSREEAKLRRRERSRRMVVSGSINHEDGDLPSDGSLTLPLTSRPFAPFSAPRLRVN